MAASGPTSPTAATAQPVSAAGNVGGYAEVMNVTANQVFPVETDLPDEWLEPARLRDHDRARRRSSTSRGSQPARASRSSASGTSACGWCRRRSWPGAGTIIAVDPIAYRRELAGTLGATDLVDPAAGGSGRAGPGADRGARRRLRPRGGDARVGPDAGDPDVAPRGNGRADQRRARRRHGHGAAGRDRGAEPRDPQRPERQRPHAPRPAALHPHDGGRPGHRRADHHRRGTRSTRSTTPCMRRPRSATSAASLSLPDRSLLRARSRHRPLRRAPSPQPGTNPMPPGDRSRSPPAAAPRGSRPRCSRC